MPSISVEEVKNFSNWKCNTFIETGTHMGDTTYNMISEFDKIYSIELSKKYADLAKTRFQDINNIKIIQGDSSHILRELPNEVVGNVFFWLDGHWSGGDTAQGNKDCPLIEEISIINEMYKMRCIIAIDDVRLFGTFINENWSNITRDSIIKIVKNRLISCEYFKSNLDPEDRMILHLKDSI